jgi:uncharacterized MAPEG superfamily protein
MEAFLVFVFALILSTLILSAIVGDAADTRHRNAIGWFVLSVLITPLYVVRAFRTVGLAI